MYSPKTYTNAVGGLTASDLTRVEQELLNVSTQRGQAPLDSFTGASDDAKLTAAMSYAAAQTNPPAIMLAGRPHSFVTSRTPFDGLRLRGPGANGNSELSNANNACVLNITTNGTWMNFSGNTFDTEFSGFSAVGASGTAFLAGSGNWHCGLMRDVSFHQFKSVLGTQATKLLMTATLIDGWFQMQGTYNGGVHIGGSDNRVFMGHSLIDASQAYNTAGNAAGQYHFWFDGFDNSTVGPFYMTATGLWGGVRVTGAAYNTGAVSNRGMFDVFGAVIEGESISAPNNGALLRVEGGQWKQHGGYIARAMADPTAQNHTPDDAGWVHQSGGAVLLNGVTFDKYTGQDETTYPVIYQSGGRLTVRDAYVATNGGAWSQVPTVHSVGGTPIIDASVRSI